MRKYVQNEEMKYIKKMIDKVASLIIHVQTTRWPNLE